MAFRFNMQFFSNKRLVVILSGIACVMLALVFFVVSLIGWGNISAFFGFPNKADMETTPSGTAVTSTPTFSGNTTTPEGTATQPPESTPGGTETPATSESPSDNTTPPAPTTPSQEVPSTPGQVDVTGVTIAGQSTWEIVEGSQLKLSAMVSPANATNTKINWDSLNKNCAIVDSTGLVVAISPGKAYITAISDSDPSKWTQVTIIVTKKEIPVTKVIVTSNTGSTSLQKGQTLDLSAIVSPDNASNKKVTWSSSNSGIAVVNSSGRVTGVETGTVEIIAKAHNGLEGRIVITISAETTAVPNTPEP